MVFSTDGNSLSMVSTVYVAILLPWAFLYLHDFISDRWSTIHRTKLNGRLHLVVVSIPLPYIIFYITRQARLQEPDYKEMFAAITAVVFSVYHFGRTIWGLYQLRRFREWACATAAVLESASYECELSPSALPPGPASTAAPSSASTRSTRSLFSRLSNKSSMRDSPSSATPPRVAPHFPNALASNSELQSARHLPHGHANTDPVAVEAGLFHRMSPLACYTHDRRDAAAASHDGDKSDPFFQERDARIRRNVEKMMVNSSIIDNEFIGSYAPFILAWTGKLRPLHRKSTLVRWAIVYLAHFGKKWLADCKTNSFREETWSGRRWNFAAKVWATAALRMETDCQTSHHSRNHSRGNSGATSFLDPCEWDKVTPWTDDQIFDQEHVLRECFSSGEGMPYGCPIIDHREHPLPSHNMYKPLIKEAIESLPTQFYEDVEFITPDHLEWFAAFIWVGQWCGCVPDRLQPSTSGQSLVVSENVVASSPSLAPTDTPVRVLQDQLGFESPPTLDVCSFPVISRGYGRMLWDNRSVLQLSARVDNWIGLSIGRQVAFLLKNENELAPGGDEFERVHEMQKTCESSAEVEGGKHEEGSHDSRSIDILTFHKNLEIKRLRYQLADIHQQHDHLEQGLTFMGCVIESARSGIAEGLLWSGTTDESSWRPQIPDETVSFALSEQLRQCLMRFMLSRDPDRFNSSIQERLLWECQSGVKWSWQNKVAHSYHRAPDPAPATVEAMMLCLLGFPSIQVLNKNSFRYSRDKAKKNGFRYSRDVESKPLQFQMWPVAGPQPLSIDVEVDLPTSVMIAKICFNGSTYLSDSQIATRAQFRWQDWRDAFEGRLIGKCAWQKSHYMRELPIRLTKTNISKGIIPMTIGEGGGEMCMSVSRRSVVWEGWRPFHAGMTLFELRHSSLIIIGDSMPTDSYPTSNTSTDTETDGTILRRGSREEGPDAYERANMAALTDASVHLDSLLTLNSDLFKEKDELTHSFEDEEESAPLADRTSQSSSSSSDGQSFKLEFKQPLLPRDVMAKAQEQNPTAMHVLARWVLTGTKGFKKNRNRALLLMERALVLGRNIKTAYLLVKTLLNSNQAEDRPADVERALAAVELLWRDMAGRHEVVSAGKKKVRRWKGDAEAEAGRLERLVELHLKLVEARPRAEMMRGLGDRLSTWGESAADETRAAILYESAVLAAQDGKAMMQLGRQYHDANVQFAARMYLRALARGQEGAAPLLADLLVMRNAIELPAAELAGVYEAAARAGHVGAMRELGLLLLRGGEGVGKDLGRGRVSAERAVYGDDVARAMRRGVGELRIDRRRAEELRVAAVRAYGAESGREGGAGAVCGEGRS